MKMCLSSRGEEQEFRGHRRSDCYNLKRPEACVSTRIIKSFSEVKQLIS